MIRLADLNPPRIVLQNTYFWTPAKKADARRYREKRVLKDVANWLESVVNTFQLKAEVVYENSNLLVLEDKEDGVIATFYYRESCNNVYKKQDFRGLLKVINIKNGL